MLAWTLFVLLISSVSLLGIGKALEHIVDGMKNQSHLRPMVTLFVLTLVLSWSTYSRLYWVSRLTELITGDLQKKLFHHLSHLDLKYFQSMSSGEIIARMNADMTAFQVIVSRIFPLGIRNALMVMGGILFLLFTSLKLTLLIAIVMPFALIPLVVYGKRIRKISQKTQAAQAQSAEFVEETFGDMSFVHLFMRHQFLNQTFHRLVNHVRLTSLQRVRGRASMTLWVMILLLGGLNLVVIWGLHSIQKGNLTSGELSSFIFYAVLVAVSLGSQSEFYGDFQRVIGILFRQMKLFQYRPTIFHGPVKSVQSFRGQLSFQNVSFFYPTNPESSILSRANFVIEPGEKIAIVGESGVGKTTLFSLILRLYEPCKGVILLDDIPVQDWNLNTLRRYVGTVPQEPFLVSGSIRDNIMLETEFEDSALEKACYLACMQNMIRDFPDGLDTYVGVKGSRLSAGQKQRLALARAFLRESKMFLFDEVTSSLDRESKGSIQKTMLSLPQTVLMNTHKLSTMQAADRVLFVHSQQGVFLNTHDQLLTNNRLYEKLLSFESFDFYKKHQDV